MRANGSENEQTKDIKVHPSKQAVAEVPEADPDQIEELWAEVRRSMSRPEEPGSMSAPSLVPKKRPSAGDASTLPTSGQKSSMSGTSTYTVRNALFRKMVLNSRGIHIDNTNRSRQMIAEDAFRESWSGAKKLSDYPRLAKHLDIWATLPNPNDIKDAYHTMQVRASCERQYASFAEDHLLKAPSFIDRHYEELDQEQGPPCAERILEFALKEVEGTWLVPPRVDESQPALGETEWTANNRADCSYWISLRLKSFEKGIPFSIYSPFNGSSLVCPYLTVEYKNRGVRSDQEKAELQLAIAGSVALYNRFLLFQDASRTRSTVHVRTTKVPESLRHFGLTMCGDKCTFWELYPKTEIKEGILEWRGCTMKRLAFLSTLEKNDVERIGRWINETHHWALTSYFRQCVADIETINGEDIKDNPSGPASDAAAMATEPQDTTGGAERTRGSDVY
ncbi:hypothetical protein K490DRAFT_66604 [Saccharata proteae CBS 121410]|uniref:Uncharacterized protein n=1 Tax=Saccharata proteae CBS 121410 TaxID=1314787 RepID=A0A9P4LWF5_9PEZI|nr:hypothetical protein K490DRAFT_66604 [Saccharata proteae CBS 121410]